MLGFPGYDTTSWPKAGQAVAATFHEGVVSRLSDFSLDVGVPKWQRQFVHHTMSSWGGFSGSPIFLSTGEVAAIHNMSRMVSREGEQRSLPYGVRIDCLWELLAYHNLDEKVPLPIDRSAVKLARYEQPDPQADKLWKVRKLVDEAKVLSANNKYSESVAKLNEARRIEPNYGLIYYERQCLPRASNSPL